ncbi:MAG TPA: hypothetical protein VM434_02815 [Beijerinckiaceae bacterium]|nr:hypothetical protein [Beijerinckiaceae bacterium]
MTIIRAGLCGLALALTVGLSAPAQAIDGLYSVEGRQPDSEQVYRGEAQIVKTGDTYSVMWRIGQMQHIGTGILRDNVLAIYFQPLHPRASAGVASFRILNDKVAEGSWTGLGGKVVGTEHWTLIEARTR